MHLVNERSLSDAGRARHDDELRRIFRTRERARDRDREGGPAIRGP